MRTGVWMTTLLLICIPISGCGGSSSGNSNVPLMPFSSGLHSLNAEQPNNTAATNFLLVGSLMQNGGSISGIMHFMNSSCFAFSTDIPVSGTLSSTDAQLTSTLPNGQQLLFSNLTHPGGHPQFLGGNYSVTGSGCLASVQGLASDSFLDFTGTWSGTLTSSNSTVARATVTLTQTGPNAHGLFSATGTATITGGTCFSTATIDPSTLLLGDGSTLVLADSAPSSTGKMVLTGNFFPPSPVGFGSMGGTYSSTEGNCSDSGSFSLTE